MVVMDEPEVLNLDVRFGHRIASSSNPNSIQTNSTVSDLHRVRRRHHLASRTVAALFDPSWMQLRSTVWCVDGVISLQTWRRRTVKRFVRFGCPPIGTSTGIPRGRFGPS